MTNFEREELEKRLTTFKRLNRQIGFADNIIDAIDCWLDEIGSDDVRHLEVFVTIDGVQKPFYFDQQQIKTLKEFLDSYRCDVRKRLEEL